MSMIYECDMCGNLMKPDEDHMIINIKRPGYSDDKFGSFNHSWDICQTCANTLIEKLDQVTTAWTRINKEEYYGGDSNEHEYDHRSR